MTLGWYCVNKSLQPPKQMKGCSFEGANNNIIGIYFLLFFNFKLKELNINMTMYLSVDMLIYNVWDFLETWLQTQWSKWLWTLLKRNWGVFKYWFLIWSRIWLLHHFWLSFVNCVYFRRHYCQNPNSTTTQLNLT